MRAPRLAWSVAVAVLMIGGAIGVWFWTQRRPVTALQPGWRAQALVLAGDGAAGVRDGAAGRARFSDPFGVAAAADGTIYVTDAGETGRIRRIGPDGTVSLLAGSTPGYADGLAAGARFNAPSAVALHRDGTIYIADTGNNVIRRVTSGGMVSTAAGHLVAGYQDGRAHAARFNGPVGVAVDTDGRVIVADTYNDRIRAIEPDGRVVTVAGSGARGAMDGLVMDAQFDTPSGVAVDAAGNIFVADTGNNAVRMISSSGVVSTVGPPPPHGLLRPIGIGVSDGVIYVGDHRGRVVEITPGLEARIVAGSRPGFADGPGEDALFRALAGLAVAAPGRLIVADPRNALIRLVVARDRPELRLPSSPLIAPTFDADAFARDPLLWPLAPMEGPFEITGTLGEARGGEGAERFHAGVDVHAAEGTPVLAVRRATVGSPAAADDFGTLNESVRLGPVTYVHLRVGRARDGQSLDDDRFVANHDDSGRVVGIRVRRGARFATGEVIGTANAFNHVHLNVGWPGEEHNPLRFRLVNFEDAVPPTIARNGIRLFGEDGAPMARRGKGRFVVDGRVQIVVDAWDQVNGNERRRRLGLYELGYQVLHPDGSPVAGFEAPRVTIRFDRLAPAEDAPRAIYASGSGIPFFGRRSTRFLYAVTSTLRNGVASLGVWDTSTLAPGDYLLRIVASDIEGNQALRNRDVPVTIPVRTTEAR
jgi:sugar lactone lactonase YvrE